MQAFPFVLSFLIPPSSKWQTFLIYPSVSTVRLNSEAQRPGQRSEYEINSSTVTSATCDSKVSSPSTSWAKCVFPSVTLLSALVQLPHPLRCDLTVLQQIDEETTCDNNPWIHYRLCWSRLFDEKNIFVFMSTCCLQLIVFITCKVPQTQKWKGSAHNRIFLVHLRHKTGWIPKISLRFFFMLSQEPEMRDF